MSIAPNHFKVESDCHGFEPPKRCSCDYDGVKLCDSLPPERCQDKVITEIDLLWISVVPDPLPDMEFTVESKRPELELHDDDRWRMSAMDGDCMSCGGNNGHGPAPHHMPDCYFASWEDEQHDK